MFSYSSHRTELLTRRKVPINVFVLDTDPSHLSHLYWCLPNTNIPLKFEKKIIAMYILEYIVSSVLYDLPTPDESVFLNFRFSTNTTLIW